jgi:hypothetical protein
MVMPPIATALPMRIRLKFLNAPTAAVESDVVQAPATPFEIHVLVFTPIEVKIEYGTILTTPLCVPVKLLPGANKLKLPETSVSEPAPVFIVTLPALASSIRPWKVDCVPCAAKLKPAPKTTLPF